MSHLKLVILGIVTVLAILSILPILHAQVSSVVYQRIYLIPPVNVTSNVSVVGNLSNEYVSAPLGYAVFFTNLWDLGSGSTGYTKLFYNAATGAAYYIENYSFLKPIYSYDVTIGYPAIFYGRSQ